MDVLFVCTGNICRSPMAEALLRDRFRRTNIDATVHSTGLLYDGRPATDHGVSVLADLGLDLRNHRSRAMTPDMLQHADLVLGLAREHIREAVVLQPDVWPRAFTLKELVRRGEDVGPRTQGQPLDEWLDKCHAGRTHSDLLGDSHDDDVPDPMGMHRTAYQRTAALIHDLVERLADVAFPPEPAQEDANDPTP